MELAVAIVHYAGRSYAMLSESTSHKRKYVFNEILLGNIYQKNTKKTTKINNKGNHQRNYTHTHSQHPFNGNVQATPEIGLSCIVKLLK